VLFFAQVVVSGLTLGSIYALTALGFVIIFRANGVVNFAQGEMMMAGAILGLIFYADLGFGYVPSLLLAVGGAAGLGLVLERVAYRPLTHAPAFTVILSTVAVGQMLRSGVRIFRGHELSLFPPMLGTDPLDLGGLRVTPLSLGIVAVSLAILAGFAAFFRYARLGWGMQAAAQNKEAAALVGVSVSGVSAASWAIAAALAAAAGILLAPLVIITPDMGVIGIKGFIAAILGGFNSLAGAVVGGFLLGVLENLAGVYVSSAFKDVVTFAVLLGVLVLRPAGLLGTREVRRA
jgi:branched-chain amino acid transport system permease protein